MDSYGTECRLVTAERTYGASDKHPHYADYLFFRQDYAEFLTEKPTSR